MVQESAAGGVQQAPDPENGFAVEGGRGPGAGPEAGLARSVAALGEDRPTAAYRQGR